MLEPLLPGEDLEGHVQVEADHGARSPVGVSPPHLTIVRDEEWSPVSASNWAQGSDRRYGGVLPERQRLWLWHQRGLCGPSGEDTVVEVTAEGLPPEGETSESGRGSSGDDGIASSILRQGGVGDTYMDPITAPLPVALSYEECGDGYLDSPEGHTRQRERLPQTPQESSTTQTQHTLLSSAALASHLRDHSTGNGGTRTSVEPSPAASSTIPPIWSVPPRAREALCQAWGRRASRQPRLFELELSAMMVSAREASLYSEKMSL